MGAEVTFSLKKEDLFACIQCGRCTGSCPEAGKTPFNVRMMVRKVLFDEWNEEDLLWFCSSCGACTVRCPRDVRPSEVVVGLRAAMVEAGRVPTSLYQALENTLVQKNPWGRSKNRRDEWTAPLDFQIPFIGDGDLHTLLFVCCVQAYDPRCQVIPRNFAKVLHTAGVPFGILGRKEVCCGNEIRRVGEWGLFRELREENSRNFKRYGVERIVALSPHCMNAFRKEYDGVVQDVLHYTQLLWELIREGAIEPKGEYPKRVVYHDPCFLGKQNGVFDEPREILRAIPALELLEFSRSRENSLCCEGGGGRMFIDVEAGERNGERRVKEAEELGAEVIATACPFCLLNLEDAATVLDAAIEVKDITEILIEVL
ncbi:MAG: hypothetical protein DRG33_06900 [Deltaproteobacteria bacterium]|nr:MAG: hypothetical protein DRG33_06900 [Deltaproteobacteria bacterium]